MWFSVEVKLTSFDPNLATRSFVSHSIFIFNSHFKRIVVNAMFLGTGDLPTSKMPAACRCLALGETIAASSS